MSSSGAFCCTLFPTDSIASVTTASSPTAAVSPSSPTVAFCWRRPRRHRRPRPPIITSATAVSQAAPSTSVRAAGAPWHRSARRAARPRPGQTPHDPPRITMLVLSIPASAPVAAAAPRATIQHRGPVIATDAAPGLQRPHGTVSRASHDPVPTPQANAPAQPASPVPAPRTHRRDLNPHSLARHPAVQFNQASKRSRPAQGPAARARDLSEPSRFKMLAGKKEASMDGQALFAGSSDACGGCD